MKQEKIKSIAWILGGGSGMGKACAQALASHGWRVVVSGRRKEELRNVADQVNLSEGEAHPLVCDVNDLENVENALEGICQKWGVPDAIIHCAGINIVNRHWDQMDAVSAKRVFDTNLGGVANVLCTAVPVLRKCGRGTFVVVSSWAGWQYSGFAGAAYSASKAALAPFVESINDQEGQNGLRATLICPAEVATPLMAVRPNPPNAVDLARMLDPEDVASAVLFAIQAPPKICINQLVISPVWNRIYCEPEKLRPIRKT